LIKAKFNTRDFTKKMNNVIDYSLGFLDGVERGKPVFLKILGEQVSEMLEMYIDATARSRPELLHHVYEWYETGNPNERLFTIRFTTSKDVLSFNSSFTQSQRIKDGSTEPFYDKARLMEEGVTVTILPKRSSVLVFETENGTVFTPNQVVVDNLGGRTEGQFRETFEEFFNKYFTQAFLKSSGLAQQLETPSEYKTQFRNGSKSGRPMGIKAGFKWITSANMGVE